MNIILLGAPGAGKGTQAAVLVQKLGVTHISTGDLFRQALQKGTKLGQEAKKYMEKGALVPDGITTRMVLERLAAPDIKNGFMLDGFPRTLGQAKALDEALRKQNKAVDKVIYFKVSEDVLLKRLSGRRICRKCAAVYHIINMPPKIADVCDKCGGELYLRPDDTVETVKKRLDVYFAQTAPLIEYYRKQGNLLEVNGDGNAEEVTKRLLPELKK